MRKEIWFHPETNTRFEGRTEYLEFMRDRRRKRLSAQRLVKMQTESIEKLKEIKNVTSLEELVDFLNAHLCLLEKVCITQTNTIKFTKPFEIWFKYDYTKTWYGEIKLGYLNSHESNSFQHNDRTVLKTVLRILGIDIGNGGGRCEAQSYEVYIIKDNFPYMDVYMKIRGQQ